MLDLLNPADFEQRVGKLSERLDALRGGQRFGSASGGLPYAGLDLTEALPELAPLLATLIRNDPDEPVTTNARLEVGGRRLALAAIGAMLLQGDGLADFPARYRELMGVEPEYDLFSRLLPTAMREAGLPLPARTEPKRLLEALLLQAGVPKGLLRAVAAYFVIYWRWFHPSDDLVAPLFGRAEVQGLPEADRALLDSLIPRLAPNAGVVAPVAGQLATVMAGLRTQPRWRVSDLFSQADGIRGITGVDPRKALQGDEEALAVLVEGLDHAWHPDQFQRVLAGLPRGGEVRLPSGALAMAEKAFGVPQWGVYRIEHRTYVVTPNEGWDLALTRAMPQSGRVGAHRIWRSATEPAIEADGWPTTLASRALFEDRQADGWLLDDRALPGRAMRFDGELAPVEPGVHWGASVGVAPDAEGRPALALQLRGFRVCVPERAGQTLQLECAMAETAGRLTFELDAAGVGRLQDRVLPLAAAEPGALELVVQDHATGEVLSIAGRPLARRLNMAEVLLGSEVTGMLLPPAEERRLFGPSSVVLAASHPVNTGAMQMRDIGVDSLGKQGAYELFRLTWADPAAALEIYVDGRHQWNFDYRIDAAWQAAELPPAPAPFVFSPEQPRGYMVAAADSLFVDDVSLLEGTLVSLERDGVPLFIRTWAELNWLMNYPAENRRLSGAMLRRALDVSAEYDLAGTYSLKLLGGGELLGQRELVVLPQLELGVVPQGIVDEEAMFVVSARSQMPCFPGGGHEASVVLGHPIVDRDAMENPPFAPRALEGTLKLAVPRVEVPLAVVPDVGGFRLLDDNEGTWVRKTVLGFEELEHLTLVLFAARGEKAQLTAGDGEPLVEEFYEGFATYPLASLQETLLHHETEVRVEIDGRSFGTLTLVWHPWIRRFEAAAEYLVDGVAHLDIASDGPTDVPLRLEASSPTGQRLATMEVETEGSLDRTIAFPVPGGKDHPVVTIRAFVPTVQGGMAAGTVEVRNAAFEPEIEALAARIAAAPEAAELRLERAQLLLAKGLRKAAARDFQAAIDLGMTELLDSPQYQQFLSQRRAEGFHEDLKALASFFVPFARKELSIG
ncbi:MAG: hypothetical protein VKQ33_14145 [Candidatus Sericytochromatia bacterium]|nr:hypothetical protein [Candidatus Sericytochromatia bacterium]